MLVAKIMTKMTKMAMSMLKMMMMTKMTMVTKMTMMMMIMSYQWVAGIDWGLGSPQHLARINQIKCIL